MTQKQDGLRELSSTQEAGKKCHVITLLTGDEFAGGDDNDVVGGGYYWWLVVMVVVLVAVMIVVVCFG